MKIRHGDTLSCSVTCIRSSEGSYGMNNWQKYVLAEYVIGGKRKKDEHRKRADEPS